MNEECQGSSALKDGNDGGAVVHELPEGVGQGGLTRTRHTLQNEDFRYGHARYEAADVVDVVV